MSIAPSPRFAAQADRFESLGDNCEFGFVNRKLGIEQGSLFRWASMKPPSLLALLRNDLKSIYEYENLTPLRRAMVRESTYDIGWHSGMKSIPRESELVFAHDDPERKAIFEREKRKIGYLVTKFLTRLRAGGCIYFIKCNDGVKGSLLDSLHAELRRLAGDAPFWLVHVRIATPGETAGTVFLREDNRLEALVDRFAPYDAADDLDLPVWTSILDQVFDLAPYDCWDASRASATADIERCFRTLGFPQKTIVGEPAQTSHFGFGSVQLQNDHPWSRLMESNMFRLHTLGPRDSASALMWRDLKIAGPGSIAINATAATPDSKPVKVTLVLLDQSGRLISAAEEVVVGDAGLAATLDIEQAGESKYSLTLTASVEEKLQDGERAVIDIEAPEVFARAS
jgi:hypothetical protein